MIAFCIKGLEGRGKIWGIVRGTGLGENLQGYIQGNMCMDKDADEQWGNAHIYMKWVSTLHRKIKTGIKKELSNN